MSQSTPPPNRTRSLSNLSSISGPSVSSPLARRPRPTPLHLSPSSSHTNTPASYSYASSIQSGSATPASARYQSFSTAPSNVGSVMTTTTPGGPAKFRRGHARKKAPVVQATSNPDELDLNTLTDPDDLFRMFGVRDVRGLEKRAREAAGLKVSDLRTMVGERYRDLLAAADSIVRMRTSAEKLVERLDRVESGVGGVGGNTPTKRAASKLAARQTRAPEADRTLSSPATLSLTLNLFLSLPSLVHTLFESSSFLPAARLEGVGRVIYRELSTFADEEGRESLRETFPIIERQWETVGSLGNIISRRATAELRAWGTSAVQTAETLAAILVLENASLPSSLSLLLEARTKSLSAVLQKSSSSTMRHPNDIQEVLSDLSQVLGIVLQTVSASEEIFAPSKLYPGGILAQLLAEIESPSSPHPDSTSINLSPALSTLPNYPLLHRHLPPSILDFTPFLSQSSPKNVLTPGDALATIKAWLESETVRIVEGFTHWISDLRGGARTLARVRSAVSTGFPSTSTAPTTTSKSLRTKLEEAIESRLENVYQTHLSTLVQRVSPCLKSLLTSLPSSKADMDPAYFLFEEPLQFPSPSHYGLPSRMKHASNPFDELLHKVTNRMEGKSPLVMKGLDELEGHARDLREDLEGWLSGGVNEDTGSKLRIKDQYVQSARDTFDGVYQALSSVLDEVASDVDSALFVGHFVFILAASKTFTSDLLHGSAPVRKSREGTIIEEWSTRLGDLQKRSLESWRVEAVGKASQSIQLSIRAVPENLRGAYWAPEAHRGLSNGKAIAGSIPTQPSALVLSSLKSLVIAVRRISPRQLQSDSSITSGLISEFQTRCLDLAPELLSTVQAFEGDEKNNVAIQSLWDLSFLRRFWGQEKNEGWERITQTLSSCQNDPALPFRIDTSTLHYLQRTQTYFFPLLSPLAIVQGTQPGGSDTARMLLFGAPPSTMEFKSGVGVVIPRARLGLLRE